MKALVLFPVLLVLGCRNPELEIPIENSSGTSALTVLLFDKSGDPISNANISVISNSGPARYASSINGQVQMRLLWPGKYRINIEKEGYSSVVRICKLGSRKHITICVQLSLRVAEGCPVE